MFRHLINLLYPALCQICRKKTDWNQNLCKDCLGKIKKRLPPFCIKCGKKLHGDPYLNESCNDCKTTLLYFDKAFSVFYYEPLLKELVHNFKYKKIALTKELLDETLDCMKEHHIGKNIDLILSIPMHPYRLMERGINLSHILAKNVANRLDLLYSDSILRKIRNTPPQTKLNRPERIGNIKNSFSIQKKRASALRYKNILLVDDLFTTGSTVNECAKVIKEAGANYIEVITLARGDNVL